MTERTVFECNVTGDRFGARNDVTEIQVKRRWSHMPFRVHEHTAHVSDAALDEHDVPLGALQNISYVTVEDDELVGAATRSSDGEGRYRERDSVVIDHYEPVFQFIEQQVIA